MPPTDATHVNPTLATAAIAACLGLPGDELALIARWPANRHPALPDRAAIGYAVEAETGSIHPPGAALPADRTLFLSLRIDLAGAPDPAAHALQVISDLSLCGWALHAGPSLPPALDRSVGAVRARPQDLAPAAHDGAGVLLGVVDFGCDIGHPAFREADGRTRLLFLWDQNGGGGGPVPGRVLERAAIDAALGRLDPYAELGYWPDRNNYAPAASRRDRLVHGTHVLATAAGSQAQDCPPGVAPCATLAFVHLRPGALVSAGDPADVFDGVCAIAHRAALLSMPCVVNLSLGANWGSHDGNTLYDAALDAVLAAPGRAITVSAGNERQAGLNLDGEVTRAAPVALHWRFGPGDQTPNTLRIFAPPGPALTCRVALSGVETTVAPGCNAAPIRRGNELAGLLYQGLAAADDAPALQHVEIRLRPSGQAESVLVTLETESSDPVPFDAWIDRDDREEASQSRFEIDPPLTRSTLSCTACGRRTVTVAAIRHRDPGLPPAPFSAEGATRDGRRKPDIAAPGVDVAAALAYGGRVPPGGTWTNEMTIRMSGTSAAAPHVAGAIALLLQADPTLRAEQIGQLLRDTAQRQGPDWHPQLGYGILDTKAALLGVGAG